MNRLMSNERRRWSDRYRADLLDSIVADLEEARHVLESLPNGEEKYRLEYLVGMSVRRLRRMKGA